MYNDTITRHDLLETVRATAKEILDYDTDATDIDDLDDAIHENADGLVNVYTYACIQEWITAGMPDADDYGADAPIHDEPDSTTGRVYREASVAMYYWYRDELTNAVAELLEERNNIDETQAELDAYLDTPTREDEVK